MARQPGLNDFASTLEVLAGGPLDARSVVVNKADLTTSGNFNYPYVGMIVSVVNEAKVYILTDKGKIPISKEDVKNPENSKIINSITTFVNSKI